AHERLRVVARLAETVGEPLHVVVRRLIGDELAQYVRHHERRDGVLGKDLLERAFGVPLPGLTEELHGADVSALLLEHTGLHGVRRDVARRLPALLLRALDERVVHGLRDRLAPARERLRAGADVVLGERTDAHRG